MTATETRNAVLAFRSANKGQSGSAVRERIRDDRAYRERIATLYEAVYHTKLNITCGDCYLDAYAVLMRDNINTMEQKSERQFELRAGALLRDVVNGNKEMNTSHHNLTDERALYHLATNPSCIKVFSVYPEDWRERALAAFNPDGTRAEKKAVAESPAVPVNKAQNKPKARKRATAKPRAKKA